MKKLVLSLAILSASMMAVAQSPEAIAKTYAPDVVKMSLPELEKAYWSCDDASRHAMLDVSAAGGCSIIYEQLKARKFNGDFNAYMTWWKADKDTPRK